MRNIFAILVLVLTASLASAEMQTPTFMMNHDDVSRFWKNDWILGPLAGGPCERGMSEPSVEPVGSGFRMVVECEDNNHTWTTVMFSSNNGISWSMLNGGQPVVDVDTFHNPPLRHAYEADIEYIGGVYYMAIVFDHSDTGEEICFASSNNGLTYALVGDCIPLPGGASRIGEPSLMWDDDAGKWRLWHNIQISGVRRIYYTESLDLTSWTPSVLVLSPQGGLEMSHVGAPSVAKVNSVFHMFFRMGLWNGLGHATSTDGVNWTRNTLNPVMETLYGVWAYAPYTNQPGAMIGESSVLYVNGIWRIWVGLRSWDTKWRIWYVEQSGTKPQAWCD